MAGQLNPKLNMENIERVYMLPLAEALAAFATAHTRIHHTVALCQLERVPDHPDVLIASVKTNIIIPKGVNVDYVILHVPIMCAVPAGTFYVKAEPAAQTGTAQGPNPEPTLGDTPQPPLPPNAPPAPPGPPPDKPSESQP